jgi:hypothetical protein
MKGDRKRDKFVELAERRVNRSLRDIRLIGNLANRSNYSYSDDDVSKILKALRAELEELRLRFESKSKGGSSFKL